MTKLLHPNVESFVLLSRQNGVTLIPAQTQLTRLHYFDGKFLRAADLETEQRYLRNLVHLSNQAGGNGVAHGYDIELGAGDTLNIGPGLAIDTAGRVLLLAEASSLNVAELIERSQLAQRLALGKTKRGAGAFADCEVQREAPSDVPRATELYLIVISHAEALCGQEDVFGKLCEEACETGTDRPYLVEGVIVRAVPLRLHTPLRTSRAVTLTRTHQRSLVASAYFEDERQRIASLISKAGLEADAWCFGADAAVGDGVAIGVLARSGSKTLFLDAWTARRERIDTPAKRYWQWRMAMRPWDVFLAQVLQFQCQLHDLFKHAPDPGGTMDPCDDEHRLIAHAAEAMAELTSHYERVSQMLTKLDAFSANTEFRNSLAISGGIAQYGDLQKKLLLAKHLHLNAPRERLLIRGGIVELPSGGYLPVTPGEAMTINKQVRMMMGEGVDLRFCVVRPDYVAHALEEVQHMERISLLEGLDDPMHKPAVDILVPNGQILEDAQRGARNGFEATVSLLSLPGDDDKSDTAVDPAKNAAAGGTEAERAAILQSRSGFKLKGAARSERLPSGGGAFHLAAFFQPKTLSGALTQGRSVAGSRGMSARKGSAAKQESEPDADAQADIFTRLTRLVTDYLRTAGAESEPDESDLAAADETMPDEESEAAERAEADDESSEGARGRSVAAAASTPRAQIIVTPPRHPGLALWTTMRSEQDLFQMNLGDSTHVEGRLILGVGSAGVAAELRGQGDFTVEQPSATTGQAKQLRGRISGLGVNVTYRNGQRAQSDPVEFELDTTIVLEANPHGPGSRIRIRLKPQDEDDDDTSVVFSAILGDEPLHVVSQVHQVSGRSRRKLLGTELLANPDVFEAGNASHTQALDALHLIGLLRNEPRFADRAARVLFPPPPPLTDELIVRGTLDWVLFHRRRTKDCGAEPQRHAPAATRRYQVYEIHAADLEEQLPFIRKTLRSGSAVISRLEPKRVTVVEYAAGVPALTSDLNLVLHDWQNANPGALLGYGAIASQGAALNEGESLALNRLQRMEEAVVSVSHPDTGLISEVLPNVPAVLAVQGTDGVIVLVTGDKEVKTVCHSVYLAHSIDFFEGAVALIKQGHVQDAIIRNQLTLLTPAVLFNEGTDDAVDNTAKQVALDWAAKGGKTPLAAAVVSRAEVTDTAELATRMAQAKLIKMEIADFGDAPFHVATSDTLPTQCPVFTIIASGVATGPSAAPKVSHETKQAAANRKSGRKGSKG